MSEREGRASKRDKRTESAQPRRIRLASALGSLSETDRIVLSLYLLEDLSVLEIAGTLKLTTREVGQRRVSALASIARQLGTPVTRRRTA